MLKKEKGNKGEKLAASLLEDKGIEIIEMNYRFRRAEIDLIGLLDNQILIFVEVKLRKDARFGQPESFISDRQQEMIMEAAEDYMEAINWHGRVRFDIVAINESANDLLHIEDVF